MNEKTEEQTRLFTQMVAKKQGWKLNPDESFYEDLVEGLTNNYNRHGYYLCPCRDSDGSRETDKDFICPCVWSWQDISEFGNCYCALFISESLAASGEQPASIPDRRYET
jgi:ferredoxin-thioredoxin reductase catalytic subunit